MIGLEGNSMNKRPRPQSPAGVVHQPGYPFPALDQGGHYGIQIGPSYEIYRPQLHQQVGDLEILVLLLLMWFILKSVHFYSDIYVHCISGLLGDC